MSIYTKKPIPSHGCTVIGNLKFLSRGTDMMNFEKGLECNGGVDIVVDQFVSLSCLVCEMLLLSFVLLPSSSYLEPS